MSTTTFKPLKIERCCQTCVSFHPITTKGKDDVGECHYNAPEIKGLNEVGEFSSFGVWPTVSGSNHCGRWALGIIPIPEEIDA